MSQPNPTQRFSNRVSHYLRARPGYPDEAIEYLSERAALRPEHVLADVGSGTGILTEKLLRLGNTVHAVEPNAPMREAAEQLLGGWSNFHSVNGTAEATTLPGASVEGVLAAQAFHWFDIARTREEFLRILRPGGWVALLWNTRELDSTPFLRAYEGLLREFGTDYAAVDHRNIDEEKLRAFYQAPYERRGFRNVQRLDYTGIEGRLLSCSYVPAAGAPRYEEMLTALREIYDAHAVEGIVEILYETEVYWGRVKG